MIDSLKLLYNKEPSLGISDGQKGPENFRFHTSSTRFLTKFDYYYKAPALVVNDLSATKITIINALKDTARIIILRIFDRTG